MAGLSDILTTAQNLVSAVNGVATTYLKVQGQKNTAGITATTLVQAVPGRICTVIVLAASSAVGAIYDTNSASSTANKIYVIPATVGVYVVNMPLNIGLLVAPGSGQTVTVSYSA